GSNTPVARLAPQVETTRRPAPPRARSRKRWPARPPSESGRRRSPRTVAMRQQSNRPLRLAQAMPRLAALAVALIVAPWPAMAGKLSWLDEVVQEVMVEARAGGKAVAEGDRAAARSAGRLFVREADEGLETLARRS